MLTNEYIILGLVFAAVFLTVAGLFPVYFFQPRASGTAAEMYALRQVSNPERTALIQLFCAGLGFCLVLLLCMYLALEFWLCFLLAVLGGIVLYILPGRVIAWRISRRNWKFEMQMLDFTVAVVGNLRSGFALPNAIELAIEHLGNPIRQDFSLMLAEYRLGVELSEAIKRMNDRISSENLQLFTATVCVAIRSGGSIAEVLENLIHTIRKRKEMEGKIRSLTAQFNFESLCMILLPIPVFLVLYLLDPELMRPLLTTKTGWWGIATIVVLELIGFKALRSIGKVRF
jgi:tight adherence protein B